METTIARDRESMLRLMLEINQKINSTLDLEEVLNFILESVREIIPYDAGGIYLFHRDTETVRYVVGWGYSDDEQIELPLKSLGGIVGEVIATGEAEIANEALLHPLYLGCRPRTRSQMTVPIKSDGRVRGAFNLESDLPNSFTDEHLEWLTVLATQAAISIEKALLHEALLEKKRLEEQLRIARQVQLSLLPTQPAHIEGLDVAGINVPAENIGGDYFDLIPIVQGHLGLVVADVSGKGVPASLIMAGFRAMLRAEIRNNYSIRTIFAKVNNLLEETLDYDQFVSAFYGVLDLERRRFTYSNAGHHPAILLRADGKPRYLKSGGMVLGVFADASYNERFVDLAAGDVLVLYTDGLVEAENRPGEMFGRERLEQCLAANMHLDARDLCQAAYAAMREFTEGGRLEDDTTIVVAKVLGPMGPSEQP